jgi:hypothetical protein
LSDWREYRHRLLPKKKCLADEHVDFAVVVLDRVHILGTPWKEKSEKQFMPTTSDLLNWIFNGLQIEVDHMLLAAQLKFCL